MKTGGFSDVLPVLHSLTNKHLTKQETLHDYYPDL